MRHAPADITAPPGGARGEARWRASGASAIEVLEVTVCSVPVEGGVETDATLAWSETTCVVVEVEAGGCVGLGYTYGSPAAAEVIREHLSRFVLGASALSPQRLHAEMTDTVRNLGRAGVCAMAISAVDSAVWDLKARLLGLPLCELLGRRREDVPAYGSGGLTSMSDDDLAEQVRGWMVDGLRAVKIKIGVDAEADERRLRLVAGLLDNGCTLMADANGAWRGREAVRWCERIAPFGVCYIEEPCSSEDEAGLVFVRDHAPAAVDVAAGEYVYGREDAFRLLRAGAVDILQADVTRCGGITGFMGIAEVAGTYRVPLSAHCAPALTAHPGLAAEGLAHVELFQDHVRVESMLFNGIPVIRGGCLVAPDGLGNGLSWNAAGRARFCRDHARIAA